MTESDVRSSDELTSNKASIEKVAFFIMELQDLFVKNDNDTAINELTDNLTAIKEEYEQSDGVITNDLVKSSGTYEKVNDDGELEPYDEFVDNMEKAVANLKSARNNARNTMAKKQHLYQITNEMIKKLFDQFQRQSESNIAKMDTLIADSEAFIKVVRSRPPQ